MDITNESRVITSSVQNEEQASALESTDCKFGLYKAKRVSPSDVASVKKRKRRKIQPEEREKYKQELKAQKRITAQKYRDLKNSKFKELGEKVFLLTTEVEQLESVLTERDKVIENLRKENTELKDYTLRIETRILD